MDLFDMFAEKTDTNVLFMNKIAGSYLRKVKRVNRIDNYK